nr:hypothetical protein B0A51_12858 [Rachicladosporium sp. CCFEE 5018]
MDDFDETSPMDQEYIDDILYIDYHQNMDYTDLILDESERFKHIVPLYYIDHAQAILNPKCIYNSKYAHKANHMVKTLLSYVLQHDYFRYYHKSDDQGSDGTHSVATNETPTRVESPITPVATSSATSSAAPFHLTAVHKYDYANIYRDLVCYSSDRDEREFFCHCSSCKLDSRDRYTVNTKPNVACPDNNYIGPSTRTTTSGAVASAIYSKHLDNNPKQYPCSCVRSSDYIAVDIPYKIDINSDHAPYYTIYYACDHADDSAYEQAHDSGDGTDDPNNIDPDSETASAYDFDNACHRHCARDYQQQQAKHSFAYIQVDTIDYY